MSHHVFKRPELNRENIILHLDSLAINESFYNQSFKNWDDIDEYVNFILHVRGQKYFRKDWTGKFENYEQVMEMVQYYHEKMENLKKKKQQKFNNYYQLF